MSAAVRRLLESERETERQFVAGARSRETEPMEEAVAMRPDLAPMAAGDVDLAPLKNEPRFKSLIRF